ncbi:MAG: hypothetical protein K9L68_15005, partial [Spirochaetales bacterium]|nr:hypothetical protein [Spirochaetales bacterium]
MKLPEWYDDTEEVTPDVQPKGKVRPEWYTPEETSDERKKAIKDISEQQETITPRVQASVYLADRLDMKPSTVFRNFDTVAKEFWQTTTSPQGAMDSIRRAWDIGTKEYDLGKLSYRKMMGEDVDEQIQELKDAMPAEDQKKRAFPASFLKSFARMAPITAGGMRRGAQEGLALGAGGAAAAAIGGQLGPQAAFAEELVTIPGAFVGMFGVGATKGTMQDIGQVEAGLAYDEMVGEGIPHRIAMAASSGVGVVNAALETMQIKRVPGADALIDMALRRGVRNVMRNGAIRGAAAEFAKSYTKNIPEQVLQELAQETTNVLATETAKEFANLSEKKNIDKATGEEIANRMVETAKESAKAFTVMGLPGAVGSSVHAAKSSKQLQSATDNVQQIDIEEEIWNKLAEAEGGDLDDLVAAINEQTGQQDRMETSVELTTEGVKVVENGKAKKVDFEVDDDAVTISSFADMEPVTARNTLAKIQTEYPDRMLQFSEAMENAPKVKRAIEDLDQNARILNF